MKTKPENEVATNTAKEKAAAAELLMYGLLAVEIGSDFFTTCVAHVTSGCTFEGMENAEPELKNVIAYRSAKSTIRKALKSKVKLTDGEGKPKAKGVLAKESKSEAVKDDKTGTAPNGTEPQYKLSEPRDVVKLALLMMNEASDQGKALREEFVADVYAASKAAQIELAERTTPAKTGTNG
jgi:hypothetical protein